MDREFGFMLLKNILQSAFLTDVYYMKSQSEWKQNIPSEIAQILQPNSYTLDMRFQSVGRKRNECLYVTRTNLDFYMIHLFFSADKADGIVIGPFRSETVLAEEFSKKIAEHPFLSSRHRQLLAYYANLPCVSLQKMIHTICYITDMYIMPGQSVFPVYTDFSAAISNCYEPLETNEFLTRQRIDRIDEIVKDLREAVIKGDTGMAETELKKFLKETELLAEPETGRCKRNLHMVHQTLFMLIYHAQTAYRMDIFELHRTVVERIEHVQTCDEAIKLAFIMCDEYCMLFRKSAFPECSKQISDVIQYIHVHLQEKLTLSVLAEYFRVVPSKLSASFKQSTGVTVTAYIQEVRIHQAMDYLHNSMIPVSEIALATGFSDFAYFSKVFKKHTGYSPTEYREKIKKDC